MDVDDDVMERTSAEMVAFAAWIGVHPKDVPGNYKSHTCKATMEAWRRVAIAVLDYGRLGGVEGTIKAIEAENAELRKALIAKEQEG